MKNVNISTQNESVAKFWIDIEGDIHDSECEAEVCGVAGSVTMDAFFVGSLQDMRKYAIEAYNAN